MSTVSIAQKLGVVTRVLLHQVRRSRLVSALLSAVRATASSFGRVLHQLWLEVTGFTFLAIAGIGALTGFREYAKFQSHHEIGPWRLVLAIGFTVSFAWFGISSFWRLRRRKI